MKRISLFLLLFFLVILAKAADPDSSLYHYIWLCNGQLRECTLQIDDQLLEYYRNERDHIAYRYSGFGTDQPQSPANYSGFMFSEYGHERISWLMTR